MLAGARRRDRLIGVQMIRRRNRDDVDVRCGKDVVVVGGDARVRNGQPCFREARARALHISSADPCDRRVRVALKRRDVLRRAPADAQDGHAQFSIRSGHFGAVA